MLPRLRCKRKVRVHTRIRNPHVGRLPLTGLLIRSGELVKATMRHQMDSETEVHFRGSVYGFRDQRSPAASSFSGASGIGSVGDGHAGPASVVVHVRFRHCRSRTRTSDPSLLCKRRPCQQPLRQHDSCDGLSSSREMEIGTRGSRSGRY